MSQFKIWDSKGQTEISNVAAEFKNAKSDKFIEMGTAVVDLSASSSETEIISGIETITSLGNNYPNPFNVETTIEYSLAGEEHVTILIYNLIGEKVKTLVDNDMKQGSHFITWDRQDDNGNILASGTLQLAGQETMTMRFAFSDYGDPDKLWLFVDQRYGHPGSSVPRADVSNNCTDVCVNIDGLQATVPPGMQLIGGECVSDVCLNLDGFQASLPPGYMLDSNGDCVPDF